MDGHVRKRGNKWYFSFELASVNGKRKRIERVGGSTKKEALKAMRSAMTQFDETGRVIIDSDMSVRDYYDYWLENYAKVNLKYNTCKSYETLIRTQIEPHIGKLRLSSINPPLLQQMINDIYNSGVSKSTMSVICAILSKAFKMAVFPYQLIKDNPTQYIMIPKYKNNEQKEMRILTREEYLKILDILTPKHIMNILYQIAFHTGMRLGEILGLTWDNVDLKAKTISIKHTLIEKPNHLSTLASPKTKSSIRTIDINNTLANALHENKKYQNERILKYGPHYVNKNLVCCKENGDFITRGSVTAKVHYLRKRLGIDFTFHTLRHTHASLLLEANIDYKAIQKRLGHSNVTTTINTYAHLTDKIDEKTRNALENLI